MVGCRDRSSLECGVVGGGKARMSGGSALRRVETCFGRVMSSILINESAIDVANVTEKLAQAMFPSLG